MNITEALTIFSTIQKCRNQALHTNDCGNCERCQYRLEQEQIDGAVALAIAALEKQIPKRKLEKDQYNENLFTLRCPTCGAVIANYNRRLDRFAYMMKKNYCFICGQAIDFSKPQQEEQDG